MYVGGQIKAGLVPISRDEMYLFFLETRETPEHIEPAQWPELLRRALAEFSGTVASIRESIDLCIPDRLSAAVCGDVAEALAQRSHGARRRRCARYDSSLGIRCWAGGGRCDRSGGRAGARAVV